MIAGMLIHDGDAALAGHLMSTKDNAFVSVRVHGLWSIDLRSALSEMCGMAAGTNTRKPLVHVWASPLMERDDVGWEEYWGRFEVEFGLTGAPYVEVTHLKFSGGGRVSRHRHRAYLRIAPNGRVIPMRWSAPRLEKLSRIDEFMCGEPLTSGVFNRSVIRHLREEGLDVVAEAMIAAGLDWRQAVSTCSPAERAASARLGDVAPDDIKKRVFTIISAGASGADLVRAFEQCGYRLAQGDKAIVIVTPMGQIVPLLRGYNQIARSRGSAPMRKAEIDKRLAGVVLPMASSLRPVAGAGPLGPKRVGANRRQSTPAPRKAPFLRAVLSARDPTRPRDTTPRSPDFAPVDPDHLAPDQVRALRAWMKAMFHDVPKEHAVDKTVCTVNHRPLTLPTVSRCDPVQCAESEAGGRRWTDRYRADLAGLPAALGKRLNWVDRAGDVRRVRLKSNEVLTVTTHHIEASAATENAADIMVHLAAGMRWRQVTITGGTREWREAAARFATRAGIDVATPELHDVVADERELIEARRLVRFWLAARQRAMFNNDADKADALMLAALSLRDSPRVHDVLFPEDISDLRLDLLDSGEAPYPPEIPNEQITIGIEPDTSLRI